MNKKLQDIKITQKPTKTAVMGGSFDPFHLAHLNSLLTVKEVFHLDCILLIPSFKTPLKKNIQGSSSFDRLNMLSQLVQSYPFMSVDVQEISRKGISYTYKTINELFKKRKEEELFFVMGLDQFCIFDQWKNYEEILQKSHLIVTSRPGLKFPKKRSDFPEKLQPFIKSKILKESPLKSIKKFSYKENHKSIFFLPLKDMDISSSDIRQRIKAGKIASHLIPKEVDDYIKRNKLYTDQENSLNQNEALVDFIVKEAEKKQAYNIKFYDLRSRPIPFSFGLIMSASNVRQTKALAQHLKRNIKTEFKLSLLNEERSESSRWIVLDCHELVLHIFYDYTRRFYNLEELWKDCEFKLLSDKANFLTAY